MSGESDEAALEAHTRAVEDTARAEEAEYFVRLCAADPRARVRGARRALLLAVSNPRLAAEYDRAARGLQRVRCLVPLSSLPPGNGRAELAARGFRVPPGGLELTAGALPRGAVEAAVAAAAEADNAERARRGRRPRRRARRLADFCVAEAAVGKPLAVRREAFGEDGDEAPALPRGYHSFLVREDGDAGADEAPLYGATFRVVSAAQVLPLFLVRAELGEAEPAAAPCKRCGKAATVYCEHDRAHMCDACNEAVHSADPLLEAHVRVPIRGPDKGFGLCEEHGREVEYYCGECSVPVCITCKMEGSHAGGEAVHHQLTRVGTAYDAAVAASRRPDPALERRKESLRQQMTAVEAKMRVLAANEDRATKALMRQLEDALHALQEHVEASMSTLVGESLDLNRQYAELEWSDKFLDEQQERCGPVEFLAAWRRHQRLRERLHAAPAASHFSLDVDTRVEINGAIRVGSAVRADDGPDGGAAAGGAAASSEGWQRQALAGRQHAKQPTPQKRRSEAPRRSQSMMDRFRSRVLRDAESPAPSEHWDG